VGRFIKNWPFLTVGLVTFALFVGLEAVGDAGRDTPIAQGIIPMLRVLIVPIWAMRYLEVFVGMGAWPLPAQLFVAAPVLFTPYVLADIAFQRILPGRGCVCENARRHTY
jgi:hypothetical protein